MTSFRGTVAAALRHAIQDRPAIVFVIKGTDVLAWQQLLHDAELADVLVIDLSDDKLMALVAGSGSRDPGVIGQLAAHHELIRILTAATPGTPLIEDFDSLRRAVLLAPDPLDPTQTSERALLGAKSQVARIVEDKTVIDSLWDRAGVDRVAATVCDIDQLPSVIAAMDAGTGVVISAQQRGAGPLAAGEGISWLLAGARSACFPDADTADLRLRIMPLLHGLPCRIHGMTVAKELITFPPLELVSLPRPASGTFFWAGAVPARTIGPRTRTILDSLTRRVGSWLADLGHHGAFAVDGILTEDGYRPTEVTTRLTSAFEGAEPEQRVLLHAANLLARAGQLSASRRDLQRLAESALTSRVDLYGASATATASGTHALRWTPTGPQLTTGPQADGTIRLTRSPRGWLLHAHLQPAALPTGQATGVLAPEVFKLADTIFGTQFGELIPPFGLTQTPVPRPRGSTGRSYQRQTGP